MLDTLSSRCLLDIQADISSGRSEVEGPATGWENKFRSCQWMDEIQNPK